MNWNSATNEPNDSFPGEDCAEIYCSGANKGKWNDLADSTSLQAYLVEYDSPGSITDSKTVAVTPARTLTYNANGADSGSVPSTTSHADGSAATVAGNSGNLTEAGKAFAGWNTEADGSGTGYYPGETFTITTNAALYAVWADETTVDCSAGTASFTVGSATGTVVDSSLTLSGSAMLTGAKVYITTGFDAASDVLDFTETSNISGTYNTATGTLTLTGTATPAEYQTALRSVTFETSASAIGTRTVTFALGNKLAFDGHNYEYVNNGGSITWTAALTAAADRTYYGENGYLATITSQEENDFLAGKLAGDAWIGSSDATTEGAWYWVTGPETGTLISTGLHNAMTTYAGVYTNWSQNQPDNFGAGAGEDYGEIYFGGANSGKWNDLPVNAAITGYLVEYDPVTGASDSKNISIVAQSSGGHSNNNNNTATQTSEVDVIVNGQVENAGTQTISTNNGRVTVEVDVDETTVQKKMDAVLAAQQDDQETENVIEVPVTGEGDNIDVSLTGDIVQKMDDNGFTLNVSLDGVSYLIPASEIGISELAAELGTSGDLSKVEIRVEFETPSDETLAKITEQAEAKEYEIVIPPLSFRVIAVNGDTNEETAVTRFTNYVERMFEIPDGVDPNKITTGIVYNADGTFSHIPTTIVKIDGKYYAKLNSLTNSTYSVIWNPVEFSDMDSHWAKAAANDLASRLVVSGIGNNTFDPDRAITRGEFAAIITKALGVYRTGVGTDEFSDVADTNIFYDAISIADEYGLITGYTDGTYAPNKKITREEAMVILAKAAEIVKLETSTGTAVSDFTDASQISDWASAYVETNITKGIIVGHEGLIRPQAAISRAEVVTAVERLLTETELIGTEE